MVMNSMMKSEYKFNKNFRKYVDEYCEKNGCTKEDAFNKKDIRQMFWMHTDI